MIADRIKKFILSVRKLTGFNLIFRPNDKSFRLEVELSYHIGPVCGRIKDVMRNKCDESCIRKGDQHILTSGKPFSKSCHAGLHEIVVPVMSPYGCEGFFFFGPSIISKKDCIYKEYKKEYARIPGYNKEVFSNAETILEIFANFLMAENEKMGLSEIKGSLENDRIKKAVELINGRMKERIKAYELAKECGLSEWYFLHLFKRTTGIPVSEYIKKVKLERAKTLLSSTDLKIASIIEETGYINENNFFIAFKKYTGLTPGNYRSKTSKMKI